jgi:hypothetical protein
MHSKASPLFFIVKGFISINFGPILKRMLKNFRTRLQYGRGDTYVFHRNRRLLQSLITVPWKYVARGGKVHAPFTSAVGGHLFIPAILAPSARSRAMTWLRRRKMFDP